MSLQRRLSRQEISNSNASIDITSDLTSLNFETVLSTDERQYLPLRARHHCFSVTSCAYVTYLISKFNEIRQILAEIRNPVNKKTMKFFNHTVVRKPIKIGVIGCGRLGKQIVSSLLTFTDIKTEEIIISTRRPSTLVSFRKSGIQCVFDNRQVVATCHVVFLCCLPSNMPAVSDDIAGYIAENCLLCSFVTGISLPRLKQIVHHNSIIKAEFTWTLKNAENPWTLGEDVTSSLRKDWIAELTFPLSKKQKQDGIVWSSPKTIEAAIYAALNMCPELQVSTDEAIYLINLAFLGRSDPEKGGLSWEDILDEDALAHVKSGSLPVFDLFHIGLQDTPLTKILQAEDKEGLRDLLLKKYVGVFSQFNAASQ